MNHQVIEWSECVHSGMARLRLADLNGPLQAKMDHLGPFYANIRFRRRSF